MQRHEPVAAGVESERFPGSPGARGLDVLEQRVDHRVPDEVHAVDDSLGGEVVDCALRVGEENGAHVIGEPAIVLLRHRRVEAPQPRLDVCDGNPELRGRERARPASS